MTTGLTIRADIICRCSYCPCRRLAYAGTGRLLCRDCFIEDLDNNGRHLDAEYWRRYWGQRRWWSA